MADLLGEATKIVPPSGHRNLLAIAGPPAAGKSTLAQALVSRIDAAFGAETAAYVPLDGFHLSNRQLARSGLTQRKGSPPSFDLAGYMALLHRLVNDSDQQIYVPDYDRELHEPIAARHLVPPHARLVITEGNYLAGTEDGWQAVAPLVTWLGFISASPQVRMQRLVQRHCGGGADAAKAQQRATVNDLPNADYVLRTRNAAAHTITASDVASILEDG